MIRSIGDIELKSKGVIVWFFFKIVMVSNLNSFSISLIIVYYESNILNKYILIYCNKIEIIWYVLCGIVL